MGSTWGRGELLVLKDRRNERLAARSLARSAMASRVFESVLNPIISRTRPRPRSGLTSFDGSLQKYGPPTSWHFHFYSFHRFFLFVGYFKCMGTLIFDLWSPTKKVGRKNTLMAGNQRNRLSNDAYHSYCDCDCAICSSERKYVELQQLEWRRRKYDSLPVGLRTLMFNWWMGFRFWFFFFGGKNHGKSVLDPVTNRAFCF